ncbi:ABC transporter permease subunit [Nocardiopsis exhalans]|uniref:ABC transporter permease subunit n=1 Tax=Nocardiopsis exhalans TaxID=163604 RepID=A0ABY5DH45_9ACTN|nr:ABC transporter permease subunit [Nocardiopsis exhalans]USY22310.1 ABC transporter permease subunit [Nocardiopsis exhalans]
MTPASRTRSRTLSRTTDAVGWVLLCLPGGLALAAAFLGPLAVGPGQTSSQGRPFQPPGDGLPLGTDHLGRDVWAVLLDAGPALILLPLAATALSTLLGTVLGLLTGWYGGHLSSLVLRSGELLLVVPPLLVTLLAANAASGPTVLVVVIALVGTPATLRFTRAATLTAVSRGHVEHSVALGERTPVVFVRDVLPTIAAPVLADAGLRLVSAVYVVASIGFLGFGGPTLGDSWARMTADNLSGVPLNPWALAAPAACVVALAVSVNLIADRCADRFRRGM